MARKCSACGYVRKPRDKGLSAYQCPKCGAVYGETSPRPAPTSESVDAPAATPGAPPTARLKKRTEFAGTGCVIQGLGLLLLWFWPIGTLLGLVLFVAGSVKSVYRVCGACGNRVADRHVKICPVCKARFAR